MSTWRYRRPVDDRPDPLEVWLMALGDSIKASTEKLRAQREAIKEEAAKIEQERKAESSGENTG